ncbi:MAG: substrate-binding domain-containing protein [Chamaesiphon sp.]|nr:substrate-binding domain-containing protein [Chamaesiphon sp.]
MSSSKKSPPPIVYIAGALVLAALGYTAFTKFSNSAPQIGTNDPSQVNLPTKIVFNSPTSVPAGTVVKISGATSLAQINQALKIGFEKKFPGVQALTGASSSNQGLTDLTTGKIDITGISRELTVAETAQGLISVPVSQDKIAIIVSNSNDLRTGLTSAQVTGIFTGEITNCQK